VKGGVEKIEIEVMYPAGIEKYKLLG